MPLAMDPKTLLAAVVSCVADLSVLRLNANTLRVLW